MIQLAAGGPALSMRREGGRACCGTLPDPLRVRPSSGHEARAAGDRRRSALPARSAGGACNRLAVAGAGRREAGSGMATVVMKFGGTSVANVERIRNVARHV